MVTVRLGAWGATAFVADRDALKPGIARLTALLEQATLSRSPTP